MAESAAGQVGLHFTPAGEPWRNGRTGCGLVSLGEGCGAFFTACTQRSPTGLTLRN
jgi:hypothetical protein